MVKWHLSTRLLTGWLGEGAQGPGEGGLAAPARQSFTVEEPNCTRHLQTPRSWQLSTTFP